MSEINETAIVKFLAVYAMEWDNEVIIGGTFDPFNSIADAFMVEDAIAKMGVDMKRKYVDALDIELSILSSWPLEFNQIHASPRQRTLAAARALGYKELGL